MSSLTQGVLSNNSVGADVNIEEFTDKHSREQLKKAVNKSLVVDKNRPLLKSKSSRSVLYAQPKIIAKSGNSYSDGCLAFEIAKISNKLESLEKNTKLFEDRRKDEKTLELERKINDITEDRLKYLEKLQHEQEQWKSQYFQTIKKMNEAKISTPTVSTVKSDNFSHDQINVGRRHTEKFDKKQDILKTPMPRNTIPKPTTSEQIGNGQFLRNILDQYSASTPNISHSKNIGPIDTIPVRLSDSHLPLNPNTSSSLLPTPPSPIKPSKQELIEKEIESEAERRKISEKFPNSISEYLPVAHTSPISQILTKTIPRSSVVADYRQQLRKLVEMRSNLENNLQAVQKKPNLDNIAAAALLEQLDDDDDQWLVIGNEKLCWIQKLVDEQIELNRAKVKEEVAVELKAKKSSKSKPVVSARYRKSREPKKVEEPKKLDSQPKKKLTKPKTTNYFNSEFEHADEGTVTHVYGKAKYHPHRTTVHDPFMHITPIKSPKFRTKRALQAIPASYVRSEKTQTHPSPTLVKSRHLAPTAISLGPPCIYDNDPKPIVVKSPKRCVVVKKPCPLQKVEICKDVCCPCCLGCGCSCCNDCCLDEEKEICIGREEKCILSPECPSNTCKPCKPVEPCILKKVISPCKKVCEPVEPCIIKKVISPCKKVCEPIGPICEADKVKCWVEQEIMSKILTQVYPCKSSPCAKTLKKSKCCVKDAIEDEIRAKIQLRLLHRSLNRPKTTEPPVDPSTPLPTPQPSPSTSVSEAPKVNIRTPSSSIESECICNISESTQAPDIPSSHEEVIDVQTPEETPVPSPEVSVKEPKSEKSELTFTDPWEGKRPNEHWTNQRPKPSKQFAPDPDPTNLVVRTLTPPPAPQKHSFSSESSSSDDSFKSADRTISQGQLIIEHGEMKPKKRLPLQVPENLEELVNQSTLRDIANIDPISEGEFHPKLRPHVIPKKQFNYVEDDPTNIYARPRYPGTHAPEPDDLSVGEIPEKTQRNRFERWKASKKTSTAGLDSVQATTVPPSQPNDQPQQLLEAETEGDDDTSLAVDDLNSTSAGIDSATLSEGMVPNIIKVTSATPRTMQEFQNNPLGLRHNTTSNLHPLRSKNQMVLSLPTTEPMSGASDDTDDISPPGF